MSLINLIRRLRVHYEIGALSYDEYVAALQDLYDEVQPHE